MKHSPEACGRPLCDDQEICISIGGGNHRLTGLSAAQRVALEASYSQFLCSGDRSPLFSTHCRVEPLDSVPGGGLVRRAASDDIPVVLDMADGVPSSAAGRFVAEVYADGNNRLRLAREEDLGTSSVIENYLRTATARALLEVGGIMLHSGGFVHQGRAYIFVGESGAGKTTLTRIAYAGGADILSDDINLLLPVSRGFAVVPVPFAGDFGRVVQALAPGSSPSPLGGLFCLQKAPEAGIVDISPSRQLAKLVAAAPFVNNHASTVLAVMRTAQSVRDRMPLRHLSFRREEEFGVIANLISREHSHAA